MGNSPKEGSTPPCATKTQTISDPITVLDPSREGYNPQSSSWSQGLKMVQRFWRTIQSINITRDLPHVKFLVWDFDQTIANMEPLHHAAFKSAAVTFIRQVKPDFTEKDQDFKKFWSAARRGFGLQEMDTIREFTKAIAKVYPDVATELLRRNARSLPDNERAHVQEVLNESDRNDRRIDESVYSVLIKRVRDSFKQTKDNAVSEIFKKGDFEIREIAGAIRLLMQAKAAGLPIALATGSPSTFVKPILERLNILHLFDVTVYNDDPCITSDQQRKPGPFPYQEATRRLAEKTGYPFQTRDGLAFEDSLTGIRSAHRAGMTVVARPPSIPWLFKKLFAPAGDAPSTNWEGHKSWEERTRARRTAILEELSPSNAEILLLYQDLSTEESRKGEHGDSRQNLSWDAVSI